SPCVLPIFPAYMLPVTGTSVRELQAHKNSRISRKLVSHALLSLLAASLVFIGLGAGASFLGDWVQSLLFGDSGKLIQRRAGIFMIIMGLFIAGWMNIPFLMKEKRIQSKAKPAGYIGTFFIGLGFAAGWTPC